MKLRLIFCYGILLCTLSACTADGLLLPPIRIDPPVAAVVNQAKPVTFAILEDYDKGQDLAEIALDFELMRELEIDELRCSFGWDDYEPERGEYDFAWLQEFVALAAAHDIQLRPYIGYTAEWAAAGGSDDRMLWNNPPADMQAWYDFVYHLAYSLRDAPNLLSYEIYNEQNTLFWWDGDVERYMETLRVASEAIHAADPDAQVLLGGMVYPDDDFLFPILEAGYAQYYDAVPFHAYVETWSDTSVEDYLNAEYQRLFVQLNKAQGEGEPIWINEMGYATTSGKTEEDQANWFVRAVSTFLADPSIEYIGIYEIKDLATDSPALGDDANYSLGLTYTDRTKKLAFYTVDLLTDLLDTGTLTPVDAEASVTVTAGEGGELYHHLFRRPDGHQILFVYDKVASPTMNITLQSPGTHAIRYNLEGKSFPYLDFDGVTLSSVALEAGQVSIFEIQP